MRTLAFSSLILVVWSAFGCTAVVDKELSDKPAQDKPDPACVGQPDGTSCGSSGSSELICVAEHCVTKRCGDGYTDTAAGEQCDDGNTTENDGCQNDCTYTCTMDPECDDGDTCNGQEICDGALHRCRTLPGLLPGVGAPCTLTSSDAGVQTGTCTADGMCQVP